MSDCQKEKEKIQDANFKFQMPKIKQVQKIKYLGGLLTGYENVIPKSQCASDKRKMDYKRNGKFSVERKKMDCLVISQLVYGSQSWTI